MEQPLFLFLAIFFAIAIFYIWGPETLLFALTGAFVGTIICFMFHGPPHPNGIITQNQNWNNLAVEILKMKYEATFAVCGSLFGLLVSISLKK
jgi:hypothetical protein